MGRRARGGFSRMLNLTPKSVSNARKIKLSLLERVEPLLKGQVITTPLWYDAMKAHPPLPKSGWTKKPRLLEFPEDKLKRVWLRRNPWATMHAKSLFHEEEGLHASQHPADAFVKRQMELMRKGMDEDDAYRQTVKQQEQQTVASPEATEALAAARAFGATPGNEAAGETGEAAATSSGSGSGSGCGSSTVSSARWTTRPLYTAHPSQHRPLGPALQARPAHTGTRPPRRGPSVHPAQRGQCSRTV